MTGKKKEIYKFRTDINRIFDQFVSGFGASFIIGMVKKPYPCEDCHRSYKNKSSLNRHQQYECGNIRFIKCIICQKKLRKSSLPKHMTIHGI